MARSFDGMKVGNGPAVPHDTRIIKKLLRMVVAAAVLPALAGCGQSEFDMRVEFYASGSITSQMRPPCYGYREMSDLNQGTSVTVFDASGTIVGAGVPGSGTSPDRVGCMFPFEVKGRTGWRGLLSGRDFTPRQGDGQR